MSLPPFSPPRVCMVVPEVGQTPRLLVAGGLEVQCEDVKRGRHTRPGCQSKSPHCPDGRRARAPA